MSVTLGTDPEVFVYDPRTEEYIPAYFALGVHEGKPPSVAVAGVGTVGGDGLALEWTQTPTDNPREAVRFMQVQLHHLQRYVRQHGATIRNEGIPDAVITAMPTAYVSQEYRDFLTPDFGPEFSLQILGCAKDFQVYSLESQDRPSPMDTLMRTSGGHIHIGVGRFLNEHDVLYYLTALLDQTLGLWAYRMFGHYEPFVRRMQMYGDLGTIRISEKYGTLEYRTLPAMALLYSPSIAEFIFYLAQDLARNMFTIAPMPSFPDRMSTFTGDFDEMTRRVNLIKSMPGLPSQVRGEVVNEMLDSLRPHLSFSSRASLVKLFELPVPSLESLESNLSHMRGW
jgi:hypothetical protein